MAAENGEVQIDEEIHFTDEETRAIEQFMIEIITGVNGVNGHDVDRETSIKFLMARKFDVERAKTLFNANLVACHKLDLKEISPFQEQLSKELLSGKFTVLFGKDLAGASVCLFTERLHFPKRTNHTIVLKSLIFQLNEVLKWDNESKFPKNRKFHTGRNFVNSKSFSDRIREASEEQQERDSEFRHDTNLDIDDLVKYVNSVGKRGIHDEYHCIRTIPPAGRFDASIHSYNKDKNRYRDVHCYDHTRVKLKVIDEDDFSDYINASYVDGYQEPKAYVCTQGPLSNTAFDFWRMILEKKPSVILMITRCIERGKEKCYKYWPEEGKTINFRSISVQNLGVVNSDDYVARNLEVQCEEGKVSHKVTHFQFIGWPDFGVPSSAEKLLDILSQVRAFQNLTIERNGPQEPSSHASSTVDSAISNHQPPLVVHCSAGIGRTGTFITIDVSLRELDATGTVDIQNTVQRIRRQRAFCVQTEEQYAFCYTAVLEYCLRMSKNDETAVRKIKKCLQNYKTEPLYSD
eukprot:Seg1819.1 transcript_id=Seg1819.1/GoldUCD/mRNA.D3Y31 product="Tyrosine-protein phosphatase non-receptor type 9" protein_id=Seg1819.1/GoldUCD/D3Y31